MNLKSTQMAALFGVSVLSTAAMIPNAASAADMVESTVFTHPSQGDVTEVAMATGRMMAGENGVFVNLDTVGVKPGHAHTLWFVAIGNPAACATSPCSGKDVLKNTDAVAADAGFAGGVIADEDGAARFAYFQAQGALTNGWFETGLNDIASTEIHLVVKDHGPILDGRAAEMLSTFRDGCLTDSISPAFPEVAFADGAEGPNTCALVQYTVFMPEKPSS